MTGKEALDDYKDFGKIKGKSITSNYTFVPSDYHYEWKKEKNIEDELAKYKRAFEILKEKGVCVRNDRLYFDYEIYIKSTKEERDLLEELMNGEEIR